MTTETTKPAPTGSLADRIKTAIANAEKALAGKRPDSPSAQALAECIAVLKASQGGHNAEPADEAKHAPKAR